MSLCQSVCLVLVLVPLSTSPPAVICSPVAIHTQRQAPAAVGLNHHASEANAYITLVILLILRRRIVLASQSEEDPRGCCCWTSAELHSTSSPKRPSRIATARPNVPKPLDKRLENCSTNSSNRQVSAPLVDFGECRCLNRDCACRADES